MLKQAEDQETSNIVALKRIQIHSEEEVSESVVPPPPPYSILPRNPGSMQARWCMDDA